MPGKRPNEPIGPTNVPGQRLDPKIPDDQADSNEDIEQREETGEREETEEEQQARESEKAFDQAITRIPPG